MIEATDGRKYEMPVGTPQGGALGPSMWREYTNDLPESCKGVEQGEDEDGEGGENRGDTVEDSPITRVKFAQDDGRGEAGGNWGNPVEAGLKPGGGQEDRKED